MSWIVLVSSEGINSMDFFLRYPGSIVIALSKVGRTSGKCLELRRVCGFSRGGGISQWWSCGNCGLILMFHCLECTKLNIDLMVCGV